MVNLEEIIRYFIIKILEHPEKVSISLTNINNKDVFEVKVDSKDFAKIIGKEGCTFKALKSLIRCLSNDDKKDLVIDSIE